jgi:hypothetical protein
MVYSQDEMEHLDGRLSDLSSIKCVAQALAAEGRLAELERRYGDAASVYLDTIGLGQKIMRGGVVIDGLVGIACEAMGLTGLQTVVTNLDATMCREIVSDWEKIETKPESFEQVMKSEKEWTRRSYPFHYRIVSSLMRLLNVGSIRQAEQKMFQKFQDQEKRRGDLLAALATRAYELEKGQRPTNIADLVPGYLNAIPNDQSEASLTTQ